MRKGAGTLIEACTSYPQPASYPLMEVVAVSGPGNWPGCTEAPFHGRARAAANNGPSIRVTGANAWAVAALRRPTALTSGQAGVFRIFGLAFESGDPGHRHARR
jgi:hypothetical protein